MTPPRDGAQCVGGQAPGGLFVSRYLEITCRPDPDFGNGGHLAVPAAGFLLPAGVRLATNAVGDVIVAAAFTGQVHIRRTSQMGQWDTTCGDAGVASNPNADSFWLGGVALAEGGEIFVAGSVSIPFGFAPALMKLDELGHIDTTFGDDGVASYPELSKGTGGLVSLLVEPDRIVIAGNTATSVALDDFVSNDSFLASVERNSGALLRSFAANGFVRWDWVGQPQLEYRRRRCAQSAGRIHSLRPCDSESARGPVDIYGGFLCECTSGWRGGIRRATTRARHPFGQLHFDGGRRLGASDRRRLRRAGRSADGLRLTELELTAPPAIAASETSPATNSGVCGARPRLRHRWSRFRRPWIGTCAHQICRTWDEEVRCIGR